MQSKQSSDNEKNSDQHNIHKRSMEAVPRWALAICAVLLVLSFAIRQIGLDITTPINRIMSAHAVRIENNANQPECKLQEVEKQILETLNRLVTRVEKVEKLAHQSGEKGT